MPEVVKLLAPVLKKVYDLQRVVAAALYAEFINQQCAGDLSLMNKLKNGLLNKLVDNSHGGSGLLSRCNSSSSIRPNFLDEDPL